MALKRSIKVPLLEDKFYWTNRHGVIENPSCEAPSMSQSDYLNSLITDSTNSREATSMISDIEWLR